MSSQPEKTDHKPSINDKQLQSLKTTQLKSLKSMLEGPNAEDDSIIDLQYEKNLNTVNYEKMKLSVKKTHATKENGEYYSCKEACWNFNPGSHYILKSSEKSDVTKFGVGIMLYFKFVKHLILFFLLFTILSIPAFVFYISSFSTYNTGNNSSLSYVDVLTATTLGSIGLGSTSCAVARFPSDTSITTTSLTFQCTSGTIASVDKMIYGLISMGTTCSFIDETDLTTSCNTYDSTSLSTVFTTTCVGQSYCTIQLTSTQGLFYNSGDCASLLSKMNAYVRVNCEYDTITVANNSVSKSAVSIIVAAFDAAIIVIFIIMIVTLKYAQKNAIKSAQQKAYSASSYTIELKNLPQELPAEELAAKLWTFLDSKLGEKSVEAGHRVVDIQIVLPNRLIEYSKDVGTIIHTKNTMIREFIQNYLPDYAKTQIDISELQKVMQSMIQQNHPKVKDAEKLFRKIKTLSLKKLKLLSEIQKLKTTKHVRIVSAFVTFSSIPARNKVLDAFISTPFERFTRALCGSKVQDTLFEGKVLRAKSAADPGSILWENIGEPGGKVFIRRAISLGITIALWVTTAIILIVSTYYKNYFKKKFPSVDCSMPGNTTDNTTTVANDYVLGDYQVGLLECYCSDDLVGRLYTVFADANNETLCLTWFTNKVVETSVTFAIVFTVLVINYGVQFVFQGLSKFEKHSTLNKQLATRVIKTFAAQFLNTGLLILLVNAKIDDASFWQGQFRDLSPLWYVNVGSTLLSTMFINVVTVPTVKIVSVIFNRIARCYDRGCKKDPKITKKKNQKNYEELYSGPEFIVDFRYSQILTLTFVCFLYSGPMPLLYFSSLLQLVITYFFDKVVLLRISRLPKNYDESLEYVVRPTLYVILVLHLLIAIFGFGNSQIFQESSNSISDVGNSVSDTISTNSKNVVTRFFKRTVLTQNIVLLVLLIIVVAGFLFKGVLYGFLKRTILAAFRSDEEKSDKKGVKVAPDALTHYSFFHVIKTQDLATLIKLTKVTIKSTQNPNLINHLKSKLSLLQQEYQIKQKADPHPVNFIGFYTYDVRVQESYSAQFAIAEMIDDETLE